MKHSVRLWDREIRECRQQCESLLSNSGDIRNCKTLLAVVRSAQALRFRERSGAHLITTYLDEVSIRSPVASRRCGLYFNETLCSMSWFIVEYVTNVLISELEDEYGDDIEFDYDAFP